MLSRAEVVVCSLLLSNDRAAFPSGSQFYFHQDHFDMHEILDLCMQITKGIERSCLMLPSLVKSQVHSHNIYSVTYVCAAPCKQSGGDVSCLPWLLGFLCSLKPAVCHNTAWAAGFTRLLWKQKVVFSITA